VYCDGKVFYDAVWQDGATATHYGTINQGLELKSVDIDSVDIAAYMVTVMIGKEWVSVASVDCHQLNPNGSTRELIEWLEKHIETAGLVEQALWDSANAAGAPDRDDHIMDNDWWHKKG
jgi:hypothetical protein